LDDGRDVEDPAVSESIVDESGDEGGDVVAPEEGGRVDSDVKTALVSEELEGER
jgi:hypothetical protein